MPTCKVFRLVAQAMADARGEGSDADWPELCDACRNLADAFAAENPRFDRDRFLIACGMDNPTEEGS